MAALWAERFRTSSDKIVHTLATRCFFQCVIHGLSDALIDAQQTQNPEQKGGVGPMDTEENMKDERQIKLIWNICNLISELNDLLWDYYEEEFFEHEELIYRGRLTDHMR